jgi:hypothetical protein
MGETVMCDYLCRFVPRSNSSNNRSGLNRNHNHNRSRNSNTSLNNSRPHPSSSSSRRPLRCDPPPLPSARLRHRSGLPPCAPHRCPSSNSRGPLLNDPNRLLSSHRGLLLSSRDPPLRDLHRCPSSSSRGLPLSDQRLCPVLSRFPNNSHSNNSNLSSSLNVPLSATASLRPSRSATRSREVTISY